MRFLIEHMLRDSAERYPNKDAIVAGDARLSYSEFAQRVTGLAVSLRKLNIQRQDRVAIFLTPSTDLPIAIFGALQAGAVFVPMHHGLFPEQVVHILNDCGAKILITDSMRLKKLAPVIDQVDHLETLIVDKVLTKSKLQQHDFAELSLPISDNIKSCSIGKDLAAILYTSGSTGRPKGVMLSHNNIIAGAEIVSEYLSIRSTDRLLAALPFSFDAGLNHLMTTVLTGGTTVMLEFKFGREIVKKIMDEGITGMGGVPSLWSLLAQPSSGLGKQPLPLRYITNTGGAMPQHILTKLRSLLPATDIFLMYGLTEAFRSTYLPPSQLERRPTSMGKAIPNTEILVVNRDGELCQPGEEGELVHHGPTVSLGYWNQPELTAKVLRPHPIPQPGRTSGDMVCYSGDIVKTDESGYLFFVGRRDNQIKSAGFRISPTEIEDVICRLNPIQQAAVVGVPDAVLGQHLVAYAIAEDPAETLDPKEILAKCGSSLPRHMIPRKIVLVDNLPMTPSGKVDYPKLTARANSGVKG